MSDERGFTIVEVLVAAAILSVGLLGTIKAVDVSQRLSTNSQRNQQAYALAQATVEDVASRPWAQLALTALPAQATGVSSTDRDPAAPAALVSADGRLHIPADPHQPDGATATGVDAAGEPLVVAESGNPGVDPTPVQVDVGSTTGWLHTFVTRVERCTTVEGVERCPDASDPDPLRRIVVAIVLDGQGTSEDRRPIWVSTVVAGPNAEALDL